MKYIQNFDLHRKSHNMESLANLNEAELNAEFLGSLNTMLDAKVTDKDTASLKADLAKALEGIQDKYKSSLKEYLKKQYDKSWFSSILDLAVAPGSGLLNATGLSGDKTAMVKSREEAAEKAKEGGDEKPKEGGDLLADVTLKAVALLALPTGKKLEAGMDTKIEPSTDTLVETIYESSMVVASKLFAGATAGLNDLTDINFDFQSLDKNITANQLIIDNAREEMKELGKSKKDRDWVKMIEMLCVINCVRSQQAALIAAKAEYEFLTGSFEKTFIGKIEGYVQALVEAAVAVFAAIICAKFISALGKTEFITDLKTAVAKAAPTIIKDFQTEVNEIMKEINPVTKNPVFLGAVMAAYVIFQGGKLQEKLDFEEKEKYMMLALEQFIPCITAVNSTLAVVASTYDATVKTINDPNWGASDPAYFDTYQAMSEDKREEWLEDIKENSATKLYTAVMADVEASDGPMNTAIKNMQVGDDVKASLSPSTILNSPERGGGGFMFSIIGGDWLKGIKDIFDPLESPLTFVEEIFDDQKTYTKYVNKENPTHAAIGGLIFLTQTQSILRMPWQYMPPIKKKIELVKVEMPELKIIVEVPKPEIKSLPPVLEIDTEAGGPESCGVYVSIVDKDSKIYKSKIGMMYFKSGSGRLDRDSDNTGVDGFQDLLDDYEFDFMVIGNADVTGPDNQKRKGGFIGNIALSTQRANSFNGSLTKKDDVKVETEGCGKKYARYYKDYMKKDIGTLALARALKVKKEDKTFQADLAKDRRMEIVIFPKGSDTFAKFSKDDKLKEDVCKKIIKEGDTRLILKYKNEKKWFISEKAEELDLKFKKRGEKKEEGKKEEGKANESVRYIMSLSDFMKS